MVGSRLVQGVGAPCRPQGLNAKGDGVMAATWLGRGMARHGCGIVSRDPRHHELLSYNPQADFQSPIGPDVPN